MAASKSGAIPTQTLKFTEARPQLSELLDRVRGGEMRIRIAKGSVPVAAIVSLEDLERLARLDAEREEDFAALAEFGQVLAAIPEDEFNREFDKALAEVRAEMRAEREALARGE